ncbi:hypothetical protein Ferp_1192 [Ferroglobus placidus DSM 10642]|uniref:Uncharacterized protein n=2 Tax=Ferroglobus placidus TaxID=54261 RepID=D3RXY7_FERPA|nr:hypothetical protein Ferp_1192 [Ferroglobus placidus DSM 10642]
MHENLDEETKIKFRELRLSWVFGYILETFDLRDLIESFSRRGYTTPTREEVPLVPIRARLGGAGIIARKGEFDVYVDTSRQIIGVRCSADFSKLRPFYQEVRDILIEDFELDFTRDVRYCELSSEIRVKGKKVIDKIRNIPIKQIPELESIVGKYALVGFRIGSKEGYPTMSNWFEIEIHPVWTKPRNYYEVWVVYRNESEEKVLFFAENLESVVSSAIKIVEG